MNKEFTGYQYIDEPAVELLKKLPLELRIDTENLFKQIYSAGKAEGYAKGKHTKKELEDLNR